MLIPAVLLLLVVAIVFWIFYSRWQELRRDSICPHCGSDDLVEQNLPCWREDAEEPERHCANCHTPVGTRK